MEYCEGNLIQFKQEKGHPSESILIQILKEVLLGLQFLHGKKMVHLDLKPGTLCLLFF
jgi:serine/threonine protein kinase